MPTVVDIMRHKLTGNSPAPPHAKCQIRGVDGEDSELHLFLARGAPLSLFHPENDNT